MNFLYGLDGEENAATLPTSAAQAGSTPQLPSAAPATDQGLDALFSKYFGQDDYMSKAEAAKKKRDELLAAYKGTLAGGAQIPIDEPSQAERYYRLAQALLTPGKTGHFYESLGNVAQVSGEMEKEKRLARREQALASLKAAGAGQQLDIEAAGQDIDLYTKLAEQSAATQGDIMKELIKQSLKPKEAQSPAGKQCMDKGLVPGTTAFHTCVAETAQASGDVAEARLNMALANAALREAEFTRKGTEMSSTEVKLLTDTENAINATIDGEQLLNQALELNKVAYGTSPADITARKFAENADPDNPKVVATRDLENLLKERALSQLKITFAGAISDAETRILLDLQGIEAKSTEERRRIISRALDLVLKRRKREEDRIKKIRSGFYRYRPGGEE